jgi:hypothetical protein
VLVPNHKDADALIKLAVHDRIRKNAQRKHAAPVPGRRAQARVLAHELGYALNLVQKPLRHDASGLFHIKIQRVGQILFGVCMQ